MRSYKVVIEVTQTIEAADEADAIDRARHFLATGQLNLGAYGNLLASLGADSGSSERVVSAELATDGC